MGPLFWLPTRGGGSRVQTSQQTCVDVTGQPAINLVDFGTLLVSNFVTGGAGLACYVWGGNNTQFYFWFNTGTETDPGLTGTGIQVVLTGLVTATDIATAMANVANTSPGPGTWSVITIQTTVFGQQTAAQFTNSNNSNINNAVDVNTTATISTTQPGYPSGHYCTPTTDALAAISFVFRVQATYLGVGINSSVNGGMGGPAYTTKDLSGNQLLFQDVAMTTPAVNVDDPVAAWYDPISGLVATQSNTMFQPTLQFAQNGLGIWVPYLEFDGVDDYFVLPAVTLSDFSALFTTAATGDSGLLGGKDNYQLRLGQQTNKLSTFDGGNNPTSTSIAIPQGQWSLLEFFRSGTTVSFGQNGNSYGTGEMDGTLTTKFMGCFNGTANFMTGGISACLLCPSVISLSGSQLTYLLSLNP